MCMTKVRKKVIEEIDFKKVAKTRHEALIMCFASIFASCFCDHWLLPVGIGEERENVFVDAFFSPLPFCQRILA